MVSALGVDTYTRYSRIGSSRMPGGGRGVNRCVKHGPGHVHSVGEQRLTD